MLWSSSQMWNWLHPYSVGFIPRKCAPKVGSIPKNSWLHHPRFSRANISATLANRSTRFIHVVPNIKTSMYAQIQLCRCPTYHTKRAVLIRSLRQRPYRMKPTAVGFISLTTVISPVYIVRHTKKTTKIMEITFKILRTLSCKYLLYLKCDSDCSLSGWSNYAAVNINIMEHVESSIRCMHDLWGNILIYGDILIFIGIEFYVLATESTMLRGFVYHVM